MAFEKKNSKFRQSRYDKEHSAPEGDRAAAHEMEGKKQAPKDKTGEKPVTSMAPKEGMGGPTEPAPMGGGGDDMESNPHGPAHAIHITHDHASNTHHVHSMHPDGHEEHTDHGTAAEAHAQAAQAGGAMDGIEPDADDTGEYPQKHKSTMAGDGDEDDYETEPLD